MKAFRVVEEHSVFNISAKSIVHDDGSLQYFQAYVIKEHGRFRVVLQGTEEGRIDASDFILRVIPLSVRSDKCPVILGFDSPTNSSKVKVSLNPPPGPGSRHQLDVGNATNESTALKSARFDMVTPLVVGGDFASRKLQQYMVVVYAPSRRYCSGVLVSEHWGITAAHCGLTTSFTASVGIRRAFAGEKEVGIAEVFNHPTYSSSGESRQYDISVFKLAKKAPPGSKFMPLSSDKLVPEKGDFVRVAGYGVISSNNVEPDPAFGRLRQVDVPVVSTKSCQRSYRETSIIGKERQICAGYKSGGCDAW